MALPALLIKCSQACWERTINNNIITKLYLYSTFHAKECSSKCLAFFDYVKRREDRHRHYCEVKGDWTVTLDSDVMIHTAVSGLNSELKTLYFNTLPPINRWLDFIQWGQRGDISLAEKRHYQTVSATRIAAVDGATGNVPNPHANLTAPSAMSTPAGNTSHGKHPPRGHCHGCKQEGHWVNKCPDKMPGYRNKRNSNRRQAFNRDAKLMEQMREFFAAMNVKDHPA